MASKSGKVAPTDEDIFAGLDEFKPLDEKPSASKQPSTSSRPPRAPTSTTHQQPQADADIFADLDSFAQPRPKSRPQTPRPNTASLTPAAPTSPKKAPPTSTESTSARSSEERATQATLPRKSGDSVRSFHQSFTPAESDTGPETEKAAISPEPPVVEQQAVQSFGGGGWWGGIFATASAAVKQAEALAKEIQKNEEAQRWAEQVKGNVGALRGFGGELRSRALPTFTNILQTLAPPISSHERLHIHTTHDFHAYPSLDPLIYSTFSRVMAQVEGGDLMVIQRGQESAPKRNRSGSDTGGGYTGAGLGGNVGWSDGPWWRDASEKRDLGAVKGLVEGTKLCRVSAENYATDYFAPKGGVEEAAKTATEILSEQNPVRTSDIFLALQAITFHQTTGQELFGGSAPDVEKEKKEGVADAGEDVAKDEVLAFAVYIYDPVHAITFGTVSQSVPTKWISWLNADDNGTAQGQSGLPEEIAEIMETGGVDPREWVAEWVEEVLGLAVGVVAQRYVARRMGVGEGGLGRGKAREKAIDSNAGEAARAGMI
ncbi:hypothetical protein MMC25_003042 [Agyrium rufum]|nr:hypothetical protein [Agyrium rufum]